MTVALYAVLATSLWYLAAWAGITHPLVAWIKPGSFLDRMVLCAACFGFWAGAGFAFGCGRLLGWTYLGLPARGWEGPLVCGLVSIWTTPLLGWMHLGALKAIDKITAPDGEV